MSICYLSLELITATDAVVQVSVVARYVAIAIQVVTRIALPVRLQKKERKEKKNVNLIAD